MIDTGYKFVDSSGDARFPGTYVYCVKCGITICGITILGTTAEARSAISQALNEIECTEQIRIND